jgi:hypothetical protein
VETVNLRNTWIRFFLLVAILIFAGYTLVRWRAPSRISTPAVNAATLPNLVAKVDFKADVQPILARCQPCHFSGGTMYERLPFDRAETVHKLGEKLFSRIQAENERKIIREFLAQGITK